MKNSVDYSKIRKIRSILSDEKQTQLKNFEGDDLWI